MVGEEWVMERVVGYGVETLCVWVGISDSVELCWENQ